MNSEKLDVAREVMIARHHWDVPVRVKLRPYVLFVRHMEGELKQLVAQWAHTAAPNAARLGLRRK